MNAEGLKNTTVELNGLSESWDEGGQGVTPGTSISGNQAKAMLKRQIKETEGAD